jgi:hypothetical protein
VEALPLVVLAIRRAADNKSSAAANELAGAAKPFNRSFHLHPEDPPPSAMRRSAAQAMGKMKVKPNRFVEEWSSFRETPEERFAFTPTSVLTFAVFGIGLPCIIYRAVVYEEARSFRPSSCQTPFTFPTKKMRYAPCALQKAKALQRGLPEPEFAFAPRRSKPPEQPPSE